MSLVSPAAESGAGLSLAQRSQVLQVLEAYLAQLERGAAPNPEELLAQHSDLAQPLRAYLASLDFLHQAALSLHGGENRPPAENPADSSTEPGTLGDFRLIREVGRGGMGIVYEAEQISLGRRVALKVLPFAATMDPRHLQRFQNEARAAASLEHPHIVPVYGVGCERGVHYYAMKYIEGQSLADVIDEVRKVKDSHHRGTENTEKKQNTKISSSLCSLCLCGENDFCKAVAELGIQAAEALEHAHSLGIVHRDIKPANLMIDGHGALWITDFGLARTAADGGLTMTGDVLGTLRYMSPEQALAKHGLVDHRTDIYSLGVTLYELLTGKPAIHGKDREEILNAITLEEPRPPRGLNAAIPRDLETIVLKAMAKEPAERYATARELADDLQRLITDEPIRARPPSTVQRMRKWSRRHRTFVRAAVLLLVLLSSTLAASTWFLVREQKRTADERDRAESEKDRAETSLGFASQVLDKVYMTRIEHGMPKAKEITPEDKEFLQLALQFYQRLADQQENKVLAREQCATACYRVGQIQRLLELNDDAVKSYDRAIELWVALAAEFRDIGRYRWEQAKCLTNLALVLRGPRRHESLRAAARSVELCRQLVKEDGGNDEYLLALALSLNCAGYVKFLKGDKEAETDYCESINVFDALPPDIARRPKARSGQATALANLGSSLVRRNQPVEAEPLLRRAIQCHQEMVREFPTESAYKNYLAAAHTTLGIALAQQHKWSEAKTEMSEAVKVMRRLTEEFPARPDYFRSYIEYSLNLAEMYSDASMYRESENEIRGVLQQLERPPGGLKPGDQSLRRYQAHACIGLATILGRPGEARYLAASHFYRDAFAAQPARASDLQEQPRYNAACAAALAGCGQGKDADQTDAKERARLRAQAIDWLRADLKAYEQVLDKQQNMARMVRERLEHWQQDGDFAGVRGDAISKLPEAERQEWQRLWQDVKAMRQRAAEPAKKPGS